MSVKFFRRCLNLSMLLTILGTVPYMIDGQTQYRHEVYGTAALVLAAFHCIENRFWFVRNFRMGACREPSGISKAARFRSRINFLLTVTTVILLFSGIMISNVVFRFLGIPYHEFWHYVHFAFGAAFLILAAIHIWNHRRFAAIGQIH